MGGPNQMYNQRGGMRGVNGPGPNGRRPGGASRGGMGPGNKPGEMAKVTLEQRNPGQGQGVGRGCTVETSME